MNHAERSLAAVAASQHDVFSLQQALDAGLSYASVARRRRSGLFVAVGTRTFTFAGHTPDWHGQLQAGLLDLGDDAVVAGRAAAALHGLDGFEPGPLVFQVPRPERNRRTVGLVRSGAKVSALDRSVILGLRCASPTLTIVQLAAEVDGRELGNAVDSAVRLRLTTVDRLRLRLERMHHSGARGAALLGEVLVDAGVESWLERRFLQLVKASGLPVPAAQRVYRSNGRHVARVDFDFAPLPFVAELGGKKGYLTRRERQAQERRRNQLQLLGKVAYFFAYEDVVEDAGVVLRTLHAAACTAA